MIYLSSLYLNGRNRRVQRDIADCREMHRTLMRGFPEAPNGAAAADAFGVLYRLERDPKGRIRLLVQSTHSPKWGELEKPEGYLDRGRYGEGPSVKEVGHLYSRLQAGAVLRFRLRANPTKRIGRSGPDEWVGKRVDLRREEDQLAWLVRKGETGGFTLVSAASANRLPNVRVVPEDASIGNRRPGGRSMMFGSVMFDGLLRVSDPDVFRLTLQKGVGSGKAYGFGLLSIAPTGPA